MSYTPEQLREWAYDRRGIIDADWLSDQLRAHADALETIEKLRSVIDLAARIMAGEGVEDQGEAWDRVAILLKGARADFPRDEK